MALFQDIQAIAAVQHNLITRGQVLAAGATDEHIRTELRTKRWTQIHPGVYLIGAAPLDWRGRLHAAVLAAGATAAVSHAAAAILRGLEGVGGVPVELTVRRRDGPEVEGARVSRSQRPIDFTFVDHIPVTDVRRTLLDLRQVAPQRIVTTAFESAATRGLVTASGMHAYLERHGRGLRGVGAFREYLDWRGDGPSARSGGEASLLELLLAAGLEAPERQYPVRVGPGRVVSVDCAWPDVRKAIEVQSFAFHASPADVESDAERFNAIQNAGWDLRVYNPRTWMKEPERVVAEIVRFVHEERRLGPSAA